MLIYFREFIQNPDGTMLVKHRDDFGEMLKRHAFFYMKGLREASMGYVDYLEKCIADSLNESD
jgi:hypothetical protein